MDKSANKFLKFFEEQNSKMYFFISIALVLVIGCFTAFSMTTSYAVSIDDKVVGYVSSTESYHTALNTVQAEVETETGIEISSSYNKLEITPSHKLFVDTLTTDELTAIIDSKVDWLTAGALLNINNGEIQFALASVEDGQAILDELKADAVQNQQGALIKSVSFLEDVSLEAVNVRIEQLENKDNVLAQIKAGKEAIKTHIVEEGESLWLIAHNNDLTVKELQELNPSLKSDLLQIGQELSLSKLVPLVSVVVTKEVTLEEKIAYSTEYKESAKLFKGETQTVTAGVEGKKLVTYEVKEANGTALEKEMIDEVVLSQPVTAVVNKGTATAAIASRSSGVTAGTGALNWPKTGKITSPYGTRSRGFHNGIDIAAKTGDRISAAAGGKVVLASWSGGYGNCILIDHGNGMKTRYAHLSGYNVKVGDIVTRGEQIGRAGNTGNSTGPHLHFEVIVNGKTKNPINYLN